MQVSSLLVFGESAQIDQNNAIVNSGINWAECYTNVQWLY